MENSDQKNETKTQPQLVWDFFIRVFHWMLVIFIAISFISIELDDMDLHFLSGQVIVALIVFRVLWGLFGSETALFWRFVPLPNVLLRYLKDPNSAEFSNKIGHSPIGALSVVAMLLVISVQVGSGLVSDDEILYQGPLAGYVSSTFSYQATSYHSLNSDILIGLIVLHLLAICFYLIAKKQNLIKPMISGHKFFRSETERSDITVETNWIRGIVILAFSMATSIAIFYI